MSIRFSFVVLMIAALFSAQFSSAAFAADGFVVGFEDLPLMDGLSMSEDDAVSFDSPTGRIVDATAQGALTKGKLAKAKVHAFYKATLPQLGWAVRADGVYQREGETLKIETESAKGRLSVRFYMAPTHDQ